MGSPQGLAGLCLGQGRGLCPVPLAWGGQGGVSCIKLGSWIHSLPWSLCFWGLSGSLPGGGSLSARVSVTAWARARRQDTAVIMLCEGEGQRGPSEATEGHWVKQAPVGTPNHSHVGVRAPHRRCLSTNCMLRDVSVKGVGSSHPLQGSFWGSTKSKGRAEVSGRSLWSSPGLSAYLGSSRCIRTWGAGL